VIPYVNHSWLVRGTFRTFRFETLTLPCDVNALTMLARTNINK
jgi:hypothetical protein